MRILGYFDFYVGSGHQGGAEVTAHAVLLALKAAGHTVDVLMARPFPTNEESYAIDGIFVQRYGSKRDPNYYFHRDHYDLIVTQLGTAQRAWYLGIKLGIPTMQLSHNYNEYSEHIAKYCDHLVVNSYHAQHVLKEKGIDRPMTVLYPIVDPGQYKVETTRRYISMVNMSDGTPPWYDKGPDTFYTLASKFPSFEFLAVEGAHGNQLIEELPNVTVWPQQPDIRTVYKQSRVVLMPSRNVESFGRISVEAAASGIPSLVSDLPGPIEAGTAYEYVPQNDYTAWVWALDRLLRNYDVASRKAEEASAVLWRKTQGQLSELLAKKGGDPRVSPRRVAYGPRKEDGVG